jgi:hypothetical protein
MEAALSVAALIACIVAWNLFIYRRSGKRFWNPLWMAFTLTAVALLYGVAGLTGYSVPRHNPFIDHPAVWVGHIVWPQVAFASVMALVAAVCWRLGLKHL